MEENTLEKRTINFENSQTTFGDGYGDGYGDGDGDGF